MAEVLAERALAFAMFIFAMREFATFEFATLGFTLLAFTSTTIVHSAKMALIISQPINVLSNLLLF